jgi:hypothetical protein
MANLVKPKDVFCEFLRMAYKEPARSGLSKRHTTVTGESKSPAAAATDITVTNAKLLCINSVTVDAATKYKYLDFDVDLLNNKIVFKAAFAGTETVLLGYDYNANGLSWIYPANPEKDRASNLVRTDYPRVVIAELDSSDAFIGMNSDKQLSSVILSVDVATKKGLKATNYVRIKKDGTTETITATTMNANLVDVLTLGIKNAIKRKWRTQMKAYFFPSDNMFKGVTPLQIDNDIGLFRKVLDVQIKGFDLGEAD